MKEAEKSLNKELFEGQKVEVLEHPGCIGNTGTVVKSSPGEIEVRCDKCRRIVIINLKPVS